jgi:hypothetical protein
MNEGGCVGLDVHARSVVAGVIDLGSGEVRSLRVPPGSDGTVAWLKTLPAPVRVVYEAGPNGYGLASACEGAGIGCVVAAPSKILASADRVKTDRRTPSDWRGCSGWVRSPRCGCPARRRSPHATLSGRERTLVVI